MIKGLGNDLIEIERIRKSIERHEAHFLNRLFTKKEQDYCCQFKDPVPSFAGRFAAKEAISKALGVGFGSTLSWLDLEILNDSRGKPVVHFLDTAMKEFQNPVVLVSISHSKGHASAVAIWCDSMIP